MYCKPGSSYYEHSEYFGCWYTVYRYILPTRLAVYIVFYAFRILHYVVFQGFPLCEVPLVYNMLLGEYFTRVCCSTSRFHTLDIPRVLAITGLQLYFSYTPRTRCITASISTPILSVLAARNKCTRYLEHFLRRRLLLLLLLLLLPLWRLCC